MFRVRVRVVSPWDTSFPFSSPHYTQILIYQDGSLCPLSCLPYFLLMYTHSFIHSIQSFINSPFHFRFSASITLSIFCCRYCYYYPFRPPPSSPLPIKFICFNPATALVNPAEKSSATSLCTKSEHPSALSISFRVDPPITVPHKVLTLTLAVQIELLHGGARPATRAQTRSIALFKDQGNNIPASIQCSFRRIIDIPVVSKSAVTIAVMAALAAKRNV